MPTFQKTETVDARQFTGGVQNGTDLALWVNTHGQLTESRAEWRDAISVRTHAIPEIVRFRTYEYRTDMYVGDWIIRRQDGHFEHMRPEEFAASGYVQV